ncbi:MAG: DUF4256 domain-containing protein [Clostridia bacterium]|nr:DUF4256 domain-containing protein [Clostridia bacterium]
MIEILKRRFLDNMYRHPELSWSDAEKRLRADHVVLSILRRMEESGGEPDIIGVDDVAGKLIYCDCSKETPAARRSLCYDDEALQKRTKNPPAGSAVQQAGEIGAKLLTEALYRKLQQTGEYDLKTSSWIFTPEDIRQKGGALFCERRYGTVFTFHNGADSYYSVRGWRGYILV